MLPVTMMEHNGKTRCTSLKPNGGCLVQLTLFGLGLLNLFLFFNCSSKLYRNGGLKTLFEHE